MIFLLLFLSCHKQVDLKNALDPSDCFSSLEVKFRANECEQLVYTTSDEKDIMIRCYKAERERENVWDTYIFRLVYSELPIPEDSADFLNKHKICEDEKWRIEAYPPKAVKYTK